MTKHRTQSSYNVGSKSHLDMTSNWVLSKESLRSGILGMLLTNLV